MEIYSINQGKDSTNRIMRSEKINLCNRKQQQQLRLLDESYIVLIERPRNETRMLTRNWSQGHFLPVLFMSINTHIHSNGLCDENSSERHPVGLKREKKIDKSFGNSTKFFMNIFPLFFRLLFFLFILHDTGLHTLLYGHFHNLFFHLFLISSVSFPYFVCFYKSSFIAFYYVCMQLVLLM